MPPTTQDPLIGATVDGRYRVISRLARGGMATVYRAHDQRLDREVAVKVLHPHLAEGQEFIDRFRREARAAAKLIHPCIVAVYDQGSYNEAPYLVMELVEGSNLRTMMQGSGLPPVGKALDFMAQVLDALAVAHSAGFVHRDVKPENILISKTGQVKVADFGLARAVSEVTAASSGVVLGTVAYLSPELVAQGTADARSDVYAAAVVLFELLTGRQPFTAEAPIQVAFAHVHSDFPVPSTVVDWLPAEIDELVASFSAKDPKDRPEDAAAALRALRKVRRDLADDVASRSASPPPFAVAEQEDSAEVDKAEGEAEVETDAAASDNQGETADTLANAKNDTTGGTRALPLATLPPGGAGRAGEDKSDDEAAGKRRRSRPVLRFFVALGILALLGGGGTAAWYFLLGPGEKVAVPTLVGLTRQNAEQALQRVDLEARVTEVFDDTVADGTVIRSTPAAGVKVAKRTVVRLEVSMGIEPATIPAEGLIGVELEAAKLLLAEAGLDGEIQVDEVFDTAVAAGLVLAVEPEGGETVPHNQTIKLTVSKGPEPVVVPKLTGLSLEDAQALADPFDLTVTKDSEASSETVPEGLIISQDPAAGADSFRGQSVGVVISTGMPFVTVPDLVGKNYNDAKSELEALGFVVQRHVPGLDILHRVQQQNPSPGTSARKGSTVTLTIV
ncbi:MAG: Stk1 family PASTA domain-containing Ser/Thr kinase [Micrococcales bacterium]|nr:Stk1 family PASTA domain-containing Ser/Thr kinase [Micrococcales bacterium]